MLLRSQTLRFNMIRCSQLISLCPYIPTYSSKSSLVILFPASLGKLELSWISYMHSMTKPVKSAENIRNIITLLPSFFPPLLVLTMCSPRISIYFYVKKKLRAMVARSIDVGSSQVMHSVVRRMQLAVTDLSKCLPFPLLHSFPAILLFPNIALLLEPHINLPHCTPSCFLALLPLSRAAPRTS